VQAILAVGNNFADGYSKKTFDEQKTVKTVLDTAAGDSIFNVPRNVQRLFKGFFPFFTYLIARTAEHALVPTRHRDTSCPAIKRNHAFRSTCLHDVHNTAILLGINMASSPSCKLSFNFFQTS
jgi:hypothetical protein